LRSKDDLNLALKTTLCVGFVGLNQVLEHT